MRRPGTELARAGIIFSGRVQNTVEDFKKFIEKRGHETGAWRGEVHDSQTQGKPGSTPGKANF